MTRGPEFSGQTGKSVGLAGLLAIVAGFLASTGTGAHAQTNEQAFRFCIVEEDTFQVKAVNLVVLNAAGQPTPVDEALAEDYPDCASDTVLARFIVRNSLDAPEKRALLKIVFKTDPAGEHREINTTVTLAIRLLALNKIDAPDGNTDIWVPTSVPDDADLGPAYLDELDRFSEADKIQKLMQASILYDRFRKLLGPKSDLAQRSAVIVMNAATDLIITDDPDGESLFEIPDFVVQIIEESLGRRNMLERIRRRFEESRTAPIVRADRLIRELVRSDQCDSAHRVLTALAAYVGDENYLLEEARVPDTHLQDLSTMIDLECHA